MKSRRHNSLIPLSREHHYGLLVCLRIHRGLGSHIEDRDWLQERARKVLRFCESDLWTHFKVEEKIVFPAMSGISKAAETIRQLISEHRQIEILVRQLRQDDGRRLASLLQEFANLLEAHIRREERVLFPFYESQVPLELAKQLGEQILEIIGEAAQPRDPTLLE
jgi:iron-sulfur cluster repair protein YtfE (RIC family)